MSDFDSWVCPLCNQPLALTPYPKGRGFKLDCKGTDKVPHRLRIYLDGFRKDSPFLPGPEKVSAEPRSARAKALLSRVRGLTGEEREHAGTNESKQAA